MQPINRRPQGACSSLNFVEALKLAIRIERLVEIADKPIGRHLKPERGCLVIQRVDRRWQAVSDNFD